MKFPDNCNMYEVNATTTLAIYSAVVKGTPNSSVLVISSQTLSQTAHDAIVKSFDALEYGRDACAFALTRTSSETSEGIVLGAFDLRTLVEGIDPLCLIATDESAASLLGEAYRLTLPFHVEFSLMGRHTITFRDLESLLKTDQGKQKAWRLFKSCTR